MYAHSCGINRDTFAFGRTHMASYTILDSSTFSVNQPGKVPLDL